MSNLSRRTVVQDRCPRPHTGGPRHGPERRNQDRPDWRRKPRHVHIAHSGEGSRARIVAICDIFDEQIENAEGQDSRPRRQGVQELTKTFWPATWTP